MVNIVINNNTNTNRTFEYNSAIATEDILAKNHSSDSVFKSCSKNLFRREDFEFSFYESITSRLTEIGDQFRRTSEQNSSTEEGNHVKDIGFVSERSNENKMFNEVQIAVAVSSNKHQIQTRRTLCPSTTDNSILNPSVTDPQSIALEFPLPFNLGSSYSSHCTFYLETCVLQR